MNATGDEGGDPSGLSPREINRRLAEEGPSGYDPTPFLRRMDAPALWLYGGRDLAQPTARDEAVLARLRVRGKPFAVVTYPDAGHGLLDVPASDPRALPAVVVWIRQTARGARG